MTLSFVYCDRSKTIVTTIKYKKNLYLNDVKYCVNFFNDGYTTQIRETKYVPFCCTLFGTIQRKYVNDPFVSFHAKDLIYD